MVQVLDSLLPYVSEEQQQVEQNNLEQLIGRYKHLIPNIDVTINKTELYTKCFVYKKEVTEVSKYCVPQLNTCRNEVRIERFVCFLFVSLLDRRDSRENPK